MPRLLLVAFLLLLAGCANSQDEAVLSEGAGELAPLEELQEASAEPQAPLGDQLPANVQQGMPYSVARAIFIRDGWQAVGTRWQDAPDSGREKEMYDKGWTEVEGCAGSGMAPCSFIFTNMHGQTLSVGTIGEGDDPPVDGWRIDD